MARERPNRNAYILGAGFSAPAVLAPYCLKSFSCNTYGFPRKCCKQRTYGTAKPFRCNLQKTRGGVTVMVNQASAKGFRSVVCECRPGRDHRERRSNCPNHVGPRIASHLPTGCPPPLRMLRFGVL